jgi:hypothetical protein
MIGMDDPWSNKWFKVLYYLVGMDELVPGYTGMVFTGLNLSKKEGGWFLVVRARRANGERVVAYFGGARPFECLWSMAYNLSHQCMTWKPDKFVK